MLGDEIIRFARHLVIVDVADPSRYARGGSAVGRQAQEEYPIKTIVRAE